MSFCKSVFNMECYIAKNTLLHTVFLCNSTDWVSIFNNLGQITPPYQGGSVENTCTGERKDNFCWETAYVRYLSALLRSCYVGVTQQSILTYKELEHVRSVVLLAAQNGIYCSFLNMSRSITSGGDSVALGKVRTTMRPIKTLMVGTTSWAMRDHLWRFEWSSFLINIAFHRWKNNVQPVFFS